MGGTALFDHGTNTARGVAILFRRNLDYCLKFSKHSSDGRFIIIIVEINGKALFLCNIYAPNTDKPDFFEEIFTQATDSQVDVKIVGGDLNIILNNELDRKANIKRQNYNRSELLVNSFLENNDWLDVWRTFNPEKQLFTWRRTNPLIQSRLDYFLIPSESEKL